MYIEISTGKYPVTENEIRNQFYPTCLPDNLTSSFLDSIGYKKVFSVEPPSSRFNEEVVEGAPVLTNGNYYQQWVKNKIPLEEAKAKYLSYVNSIYNQKISIVKASYPPTEVESWAKQEKEAREYIANNNSQSILLREIAAARGVSVDWFANKVVAKADQYALVVGNLIGTRQLLEHQILNATEENIDSIKWPPE